MQMFPAPRTGHGGRSCCSFPGDCSLHKQSTLSTSFLSCGRAECHSGLACTWWRLCGTWLRMVGWAQCPNGCETAWTSLVIGVDLSASSSAAAEWTYVHTCASCAIYINGPLLGICRNSSSKLIILYFKWWAKLHASRALHNVVEGNYFGDYLLWLSICSIYLSIYLSYIIDFTVDSPSRKQMHRRCTT